MQAAVATHALKASSSKSFLIDPLSSPHSAAVGATLASFVWNLKSTTADVAKLQPVEIGLLGEQATPTLESEKAKGDRIQLDWETGKVYGEAQNFARTLKELPANRMTPTIFCETAEKQFAGLQGVTIKSHDLAWAEEKKMGSFISVSRGSDEPLRFLELHYKGAANKDEAPLAFVGKGITFDSGGIVRFLLLLRCSRLTPLLSTVAQARSRNEGDARRHGWSCCHARCVLGHRQAQDPH